MARRTAPKDTAPSRQRSSALVAAAAPVDITSKAQVKRIMARQQKWQPEAWAYFKSLGVVSDTLTYRANVMSKVRLYAAFQPDDSDLGPIAVSAAADGGLLPPATATLADDTMARLNNGQGIPAMLKKLCTNLDVPGEAHVIGEDTDEGEHWGAYSNSELKTSNDRLSVLDAPGQSRGRTVADDAVVFRIWHPDPEFWNLSHSPMRPLVEEGSCEELLILNRKFRSAHRSRVPKGLLGIAQSMAQQRAVNADGNAAELDEPDGGSSFQQELIDVATAALANDGSAADSVPLVLEVPDSLLANDTWAKFLSLGQGIDATDLERARDLIDRIAGGLPMPPEITTGLGATNHWSATTIERGAFRHYVEPGVLAICHGFTVGFLRPMLLAAGVAPEVVGRLVVHYDESEAVTQPDKTEIATQGVNLGAISLEAWRRVAEFDDEDAPEEEELLRRLALDRSAVPSDALWQLLALLGLVPRSAIPAPPTPLPPAPEPEVVAPTDEEPPTERQAMTAAGPPVTDVGERLAAIDRRLFAQVSTAADMALERALERAGNRLRRLADRDQTARALIAAQDPAPAEVGRVLGRPWALRLAAGDGEDDETTMSALVAPAFVSLAERFDSLTERAQHAMVAEARALALPEDRPSEGELAVLAAEQADDRERAASALVAALTALAVSVLFDGRPDPGDGEVDATAIVPAAIVREALALAGGATSVERTAAGGLSVEGRPVGGVATGERSRTLFARVRAWWTGYRWEYGDAASRQRPFPPHQALAGRVFSTWDSPELMNTETTWLGSVAYRPSDHRGCLCSFTPIVLEPVADERAA